jgi:Tol biopolymer transport system component
VETKHFAFHYPADLEAWTRDLASHVEAIDSAVRAVVGYAPPKKTQIVVDNPYDIANGFAFPFLDQPVINLWAVPPSPREDVGEFRVWGQTLLSHEFTHIAHLTRPSRNPFVHRVTKLLPIQPGPIPLDAPRWVIEGYATYSEGRVTGSGRPHGVWRPAFLRQWALEGTLPRYEQLDNFGGFEGGEFAYLGGSAFLEWLARRQGDSSLVHLWRRMTARQTRSFDEAFAGVYGESPRTLYGRFTTDVTGEALEIARGLRAKFPGDTGQIVQRLAQQTGDPAISRDGKRVAVVIRSPTQPSRVIIWSTAPEPDTGRARRDSLLLARDPEDVPARSIYPPPKRVLASLRAKAGAPYDDPRFLRDGRVLLSRETPRGDGTTRPDLYIWNPQQATVTRITRGAGLRDADPSPDGRTAVADRCIHGWCDLALVDLATGRDSVIESGGPGDTFYHPRFSPDGSRILVSLNTDGRWRLIVLDPRRRSTITVPVTQSGNVYDGTWTSRSAFVATSDSGGIPNLMAYDLDSVLPPRFRTLTHVTGAAVAPEFNPADSSIWFLSLYSRGYDMRRITGRGTTDSAPVASTSRFAPAAQVIPEPRPSLATNAASAPRSFGFGPRINRWLPSGNVDADGGVAILGLTSIDVIGRSALIGKIGVGNESEWHGGTVEFAWRGWRPTVRAEGFDAWQAPSESRSHGASPLLDVNLLGGVAGVDGTIAYDRWSARYGVAASSARYQRTVAVADTVTSRSLGVAQAGFGFLQRGPGWSISESIGGDATLGRTFDTRFDRETATFGIAESGVLPLRAAAAAAYGRTSDDAPLFEQMTLGGGPSPLLDRALLTQRFSMPALPTGVALGTSAFAYKISLTGNPLALYWWAGSTAPAETRFDVWHRVIGAEWSMSVPPMQAVGTPAARAVIGAGESLDAPLRHAVRGYVSLVLVP